MRGTMDSPGPENLLDGDQAAARLRTTLSHLRQLTDRHGLPYVKVGAHRRYLSSDVDAFIASRRTVKGGTS